MRTWDCWKRCQKGSKFDIHSATLLVGSATQACQNPTPYFPPSVYFLVTSEKNLLYVVRLTQEAMKMTLGAAYIL